MPSCRSIAARLALLTVCGLLTHLSRASVGLVVGEPFGAFGTMLPVGHASIYLDHLCAASPTQLRPCRPGESGVVISRYHDLTARHLDWLAIPATVFFYGVDDPATAPTYITASLESELRERYRQQHLTAVVPPRIDRRGIAHRPPYGDWEEGIGAAFDRRLFLYTIDTTPAQDAAILAYINTLSNQRRYSLFRANCADFAANILALALPQPPTRNFFADFNITTPKNLARQMASLSTSHPALNLHTYIVPQVPGTLRRSRPLRGCAEIFVKTRRYFLAVLVLQPELIVADLALYEARGRWKPSLDATSLGPDSWSDGPLSANTASAPSANLQNDPLYWPASTSSSTASDGIGLRAK